MKIIVCKNFVLLDPFKESMEFCKIYKMDATIDRYHSALCYIHT